jgi:hypothetical protein
MFSNNHRSASSVLAIRADNEAAVNQSEPLERFVSRKALAERWQCSVETIKRRTREGLLHPVRFSQRMIRYRLSGVIEIELASLGGLR